MTSQMCLRAIPTKTFGVPYVPDASKILASPTFSTCQEFWRALHILRALRAKYFGVPYLPLQYMLKRLVHYTYSTCYSCQKKFLIRDFPYTSNNQHFQQKVKAVGKKQHKIA